MKIFNGLQVAKTDVHIMWKEIAIIFAILFLIRGLIDLYIFSNYKQIHGKFIAQDDLFKLEKRAGRIRNLSRIFRNKKMILIYNNLCCILASITFVNGDEESFINHLNLVKSEGNYELKWFMLALYYRSKKENDSALSCYKKYMENNPTDPI